MKCQHCGKELNQGMKFCDGCGAPVVQFYQSNQQQAVNNNLQTPPKKNGLKAWHIVLIVLGGVFALIGLFFCFILWIGFTFGTTESELNQPTTQALIENTIPNEIDGYVYGDFDKYNSYAEDNGLGDTKIYTFGNATDIFEYEDICAGILETDDSEEWLIMFGFNPTVSENELSTIFLNRM